MGDGSSLGIWAYSTDEAIPARLFDDAGSLIGTCSTMEVTQADTGSVSTYRSGQPPFPNNTLFVVNGDYLEEST